MPKTVEEILAERDAASQLESPHKPQTIEDALKRQTAGMRPKDIAASMDLRASPSSRENPNMTLGDLRTGLVTTAGLGAAGFTGGMSFIPALMIESGVMSGTDYLAKALGIKDEDESSAFSLEGAVSSASIGGVNAAGGMVLRGALKGFGVLGGVGKEGIEEIGKFGPYGSAKFLKDAPVEAEYFLAREAAEFGRGISTGQRKLREMVVAEKLIDDVDEIYAQNQIRSPGTAIVPEDAIPVRTVRSQSRPLSSEDLGAAPETVKTQPQLPQSPQGQSRNVAGVKLEQEKFFDPVTQTTKTRIREVPISTLRSPRSEPGSAQMTQDMLMNKHTTTVVPQKEPVSSVTKAGGGTMGPTSQQLGAANVQSGIVNTSKLKEFMKSLRRPDLTPEGISENQALDAFADSLPESMSLRDFTNYIRAMRRPVAEQIGQLANVRLNPADRIRIASFASNIRDNILGEWGAGLIDLSGKKLAVTKQFMNLITDAKGNLKPKAEAHWRTILSKENVGIRKIFWDFQQKTGMPVYDMSVRLAAKRQWDPPDLEAANFISNLILRWVRAGLRKTAEGIAVFANPKFAPPLVSPHVSRALVSPRDSER